MKHFWLAVFFVLQKLTSIDNTRHLNLISNATLAVLGQFPFVVAIVSENDFPTCSGSLISIKQALSAAHCFGVDLREPGKFVVAGDTASVRNTDDGPSTRQKLRIVRLRFHPKALTEGGYNRNYDIAVVILERSLDLSKNVALIPVAVADIQTGSTCITAGFERLLKGSVKVKPTRGFLEYQRLVIQNRCNITKNFYCVREEGVRICHGGSGGPLFNADPPYFAYAICSSLSKDSNCKFLRIAQLRSWIKKQIAYQLTTRVRRGLFEFQAPSIVVLFACQLIIRYE